MNQVLLGEICEFKYGKSLPAKVREPGPFGVFGSNGLVDEHSDAITKGPTIIVGRKGSIGEVAFSDGPCWPIDTTYFIDETATEQDPRWLYYTLQSLRLQELNKSAAIPGLNRNDAYAKKIPLPPLDEQRRIAGILDQADALRRLRTRAIDKLNTLGQAIFHEMFGAALANQFFEFGKAVEEFRYGTSNKSGESGHPALRIPNVIGGGIDTGEIKTVEVTGAELDRLRLQEGDVLFVRTNGNPDYVGRCASFSQDAVAGYGAGTDWIFASYLIRARLSDRINPIFAKTYFASQIGRKAIRERCKTSAGQFNINTEGLSSLPFPDVSREQQDRFAETIAAIEKNSAPMKASAEAMERKFSSLQYSAFRGEL
ncbi:restriction endonuclease subunit S [Celeribacter sp.]|uniref:restriction endonuclease subunit S n=1 Tax=Celeribacter sp. TaxID=1890673 RepID=UPI003A8EB17E